MRRTKGFSLIELLIVVAIILIIAAIAIPNLLRARIAANEGASVSSMRTINTAQFAYNSSYPSVGYAAALANLGPATAAGCGVAGPVQANACLIDWQLAQSFAGGATGTKSGYVFASTGITANGINSTFVTGSSPQNFNLSGVRNFCATDDGVVRYNAGATGSTPVITTAACQAFLLLQ
ncbi:MAG: prepilin-type N-terminal cleavage/methylation domain-containing protein [Terriglobales bacterium]